MEGEESARGQPLAEDISAWMSNTELTREQPKARSCNRNCQEMVITSSTACSICNMHHPERKEGSTKMVKIILHTPKNWKCASKCLFSSYFIHHELPFAAPCHCALPLLQFCHLEKHSLFLSQLSNFSCLLSICIYRGLSHLLLLFSSFYPNSHYSSWVMSWFTQLS